MNSAMVRKPWPMAASMSLSTKVSATMNAGYRRNAWRHAGTGFQMEFLPWPSPFSRPAPEPERWGSRGGSRGRALGIVCLQGLVIHGLFVSRRGSQGGATHLFAIPLLAAPATSVDVNQAGAGAAASGVLHGFLESLWLGMVQTLSLRTISGVEPGHKGRSCAGFSRRASGQTVAGSKRSRR